MSRQRRVSVRPLQTTSAGLRPGWTATGAAIAGLGLFAAVLVPALGGQGGPNGSTQVLPELEPAVDQSDDDEDAADDTDGGMSGDLAEAIPVAEDVYLSRDPFDPVVPEGEATDGDGDGIDGDASNGDETDGDGGTGDGTAGDGDGVDGDGGNGDDGNGNGTTDADSCQGDEELVCDGQVITLDRVEYTNGDPVAHFRVNATSYEVAPGDGFADGLVLERIDESGCARLAFGDESHRVCPGEARLK